MFFEDLIDDWGIELESDNITVTNSGTHENLKNLVENSNLPAVYGGTTEFDLSKGLFNEVGPWSMDTKLIMIGEEENKFNYDSSDSDPGVDDDIKTAIQGIPSFPGGGVMQKHNTKTSQLKDDSGAQFNMEALGELINQTPNATPMNTYADDED